MLIIIIDLSYFALALTFFAIYMAFRVIVVLINYSKLFLFTL